MTPANPTVAKGLTEQFTATGTYSDGTTADLTSQVTWASGQPRSPPSQRRSGHSRSVTGTTLSPPRWAA